MFRPHRLVLIFALVSAVALAAGPNGWITFTSKEGGFTVDLPTNPTVTRSFSHQSPRGVVKIFLVGCESAGAAYLAFRLDVPAAVPRGSEEQLLDAERDFFAEMWKGRVVSEKKVRAQGRPGRDFTVRGRPNRGGESTIRARLYHAGQSLFAVAVISIANGELPEDAGRFLGSLALGPAMSRASGTPEPEPTGTEIGGWGLAIDPDRDCRFIPGDRSIAFQVPGTLHDLFFDGGPTNSPRVMRDVVGDFVVTVRVVGEFRPTGPSTNPRTTPYNGAGIFLWSDSDNNIRFERYAFLRGNRYATAIAFQEREGGYAGAEHNENFPGGDCYLRLERRGSRILGSVSFDGQAWKPLKPIDTIWPLQLKVGLAAITTSSSPFSVEFEDFDLRSGGASAPALAPPAFSPAFPPQPIAPPASNDPPEANVAPPPDPDRAIEPPQSPIPAPKNAATAPTSSSDSRRRTVWTVVIVLLLLLLIVVVATAASLIWLTRAPRSRRAGRGGY